MMLRLLAGCVLLCAGLAAANAAQLTVFAAASLKEALDAQVRSFERATGHRVVVSYAGTNALAKQRAREQGASEADVGALSALLAQLDGLARNQDQDDRKARISVSDLGNVVRKGEQLLGRVGNSQG